MQKSNGKSVAFFGDKRLLFQTLLNPFRYKVSRLLPATLHTKRLGLTVSFRRSPSSLYESYPMGGASIFTLLIPQLVQAVILPQHDASAGLKRFSEPFED